MENAERPVNIGFVFTSHCNAQCAHCSTSCGPKRREYLSEELILRTVQQARNEFKNRPINVCFSGGEPFVDFDRLCRMVEDVRDLADQITCVTNAFWAISIAAAEQRLTKLRDCGLTALAVSSSTFHEKYVDSSRVSIAIQACRQIDIKAVLKHVHVKDGECAVDWAQRLGCDLTGVLVEDFSLLPYMRLGVDVAENQFERKSLFPQGRCPAPVITYREDGEAYMCCSPGAFVKSLKIGCIADPFELVVGRFTFGGIQQILKSDGPAYFLPYIQEAGLLNKLRGEYEGICDLCTDIFRNPEISALCEAVAVNKEISTLKNWLDIN